MIIKIDRMHSAGVYQNNFSLSYATEEKFACEQIVNLVVLLEFLTSEVDIRRRIHVKFISHMLNC